MEENHGSSRDSFGMKLLSLVRALSLTGTGLLPTETEAKSALTQSPKTCHSAGRKPSELRQCNESMNLTLPLTKTHDNTT